MNRKTVELMGIWGAIYNPAFYDGKFATIKSPASVTEMVIAPMCSLVVDHHIKRLAR